MAVLEYGALTADEVIAYLELKGLIDDSRLMKVYAEELMRKNYGYKRILLELSNKGISEELIGGLKETYPFETEIERAICACTSKVRKTGSAVTKNKKLKLKEYLVRRGFSGGIAEEAVRSIEE
ncbi:MAG: RecX family transcriptional regulator [Actinobacteria bacterium]|nr:RecX family transcriptional regulator [Actinomycetota bacterium]